ncbi:MAG TPA: nickel pincer cofactor biosynthesis protein LarC [Candidatus Eisenbacteria bacterium]
MKHAHFDCVSGIAGDMTLAALVSAGWPADALLALPARLGLEGVTIEITNARRGPFAATHVRVRAPEKQPHRHLHHVEAILERADLPGTVRERAKVVFRRLAAAEAEVHGSTIEKVHFHEVGAVDAIVDIAGSLMGLEALGVGTVSASALPLGGGFVDSEHGRIPVPAPATALLLRGAPVYGGPVEAELVTPTGAALLATLATSWGDLPAFRLDAVGTGAGTREFPGHPNILRVLVGERTAASIHDRTVAVLETAVDDDNPQFMAAALQRLLALGALDAMVAPVTMKKGRSGLWLVVVCEPADARRLAEAVLRDTSTLGVRVREERRIELSRSTMEVHTRFGAVRVKVAVLPGGTERAMPEFESVVEVAARSGATVHAVSAAAIQSFQDAPRGVPSTPSDD